MPIYAVRQLGHDLENRKTIRVLHHQVSKIRLLQLIGRSNVTDSHQHIGNKMFSIVIIERDEIRYLASSSTRVAFVPENLT